MDSTFNVESENKQKIKTSRYVKEEISSTPVSKTMNLLLVSSSIWLASTKWISNVSGPHKVLYHIPKSLLLTPFVIRNVYSEATAILPFRWECGAFWPTVMIIYLPPPIQRRLKTTKALFWQLDSILPLACSVSLWGRKVVTYPTHFPHYVSKSIHYWILESFLIFPSSALWGSLYFLIHKALSLSASYSHHHNC